MNRRKTIMAGAVLLQSHMLAFASGGTEGHGGDPLRLLFEASRPYAADRVLKSVPCAFGANVSPEIRAWILNHKETLAEDILRSEHNWITDKQATCAFTQTEPQAIITFSFETCRPGVRDVSDALKVLVHESVHHFGVTDEYFADKVAEAVYNLGSHSSCSIPPSQDPFDPASCPGSHLSSEGLLRMVPLPHKNLRELGRFQIASRMRTCYGNNWCTSWVDADGFGFASGFYKAGTPFEDAMPSIWKGRVYVSLKNDIPTLGLESDSGRSGYSYGFKALGAIENYNLLFSPDKNTSSTPQVAFTSMFDRSSLGWVTNSCFRYLIKGQRPTKDNLGNSIIRDYETVVYSAFDRK